MDWIDDLIKEGDAELSARFQQQAENNRERQFLLANAVAAWGELKNAIKAIVEEIDKRPNRSALSVESIHINSIQLCAQGRKPVLDARFTPEAFQLVVSTNKETEKTVYKLEATGTTSIGWRQ